MVAPDRDAPGFGCRLLQRFAIANSKAIESFRMRRREEVRRKTDMGFTGPESYLNKSNADAFRAYKYAAPWFTVSTLK
jgi:hypothetical protein